MEEMGPRLESLFALARQDRPPHIDVSGAVAEMIRRRRRRDIIAFMLLETTAISAAAVLVAFTVRVWSEIAPLMGFMM